MIGYQLLHGRGLSLQDAFHVPKRLNEKDEAVLVRKKTKPKEGTLWLASTEDNSGSLVFPFIVYDENKDGQICFDFEVRVNGTWRRINLSSLPNTIHDLRNGEIKIEFIE